MTGFRAAKSAVVRFATSAVVRLATWLLVNAAAWALVKATIGRWSSRWPPGWWSGGDGGRGQRGKLGRGGVPGLSSTWSRGDLLSFHGGRFRRRPDLTTSFVVRLATWLLVNAAAWGWSRRTICSVVKPLTTWPVVKAAI